jgi:hypothetical protein
MINGLDIKELIYRNDLRKLLLLEKADVAVENICGYLAISPNI